MVESVDLLCPGIDSVDSLLEFESAFVSIAGVGKPDSPIGMDDDVVGRVERLALPLIGEYLAIGSVGLIPHNASTDLFAANEPIIRIEAAAVGLIGGLAK